VATEAHGGRIWVRSVEGEGSTFHIQFPLEPEERPVSRPKTGEHPVVTA
jgi:signal transduction histidine kinase